MGELIEKLEFREASRKLMELVEFANKYYDEKEPWKQRKEDEVKAVFDECEKVYGKIDFVERSVDYYDFG